MSRTWTTRFVGVAACAAALVLGGPARPAGAHGRADASDYRTEIAEIDGDLAGATVRVVDFGERLEVRRTTAVTVVVLGYQGEPYLRLDADGVWRNRRSPATFLNEDRYARVTLPEDVDADAAPVWDRLSGGDRVAWHDHRSHWMSPEPPPITRGEPDQEHMIYADTVMFVVDGREVGVLTRVFWIPPPSPIPWLLTIAALGVAALVAVTWRSDVLPPLGLLAAIGAATARPAGSWWLAVSLLALGAALVGFVVRRTELPAVAGLLSVIVAVQRFDALGHAVVPGSLPVGLQRASIALAAAAGAGAVGARLLGISTGATPRYARPPR